MWGEWLVRIGVKTLFIEPGSPWENGYVESFNGKLRDELLDKEAFDTLLKANGAIRAVAAAHQHDPTAQCPGQPDAVRIRAANNPTGSKMGQRQ